MTTQPTPAAMRAATEIYAQRNCEPSGEYRQREFALIIDRETAALRNERDELRWLVERAAAIRKPNARWTKAEIARSWADWDARAAIANAEACK